MNHDTYLGDHNLFKALVRQSDMSMIYDAATRFLLSVAVAMKQTQVWSERTK